MNISSQEADELVGWLKDSPLKVEKLLNGHRVLLSEDANQEFLSFAEVVDPYCDYMNDGNIIGGPFLCVQRYGPWRVNDKDQIRRIATIVAAIILTLDE
ncbi:hypothetical protein BDV30DRAFT_234697 [Aspergillus minisclerotigenes]|uniref:Uncharacterized protein n=1 Tax=Aspergillus minisclerotigenes TaxID=656917 RepID=A0A5N6JHH6_9EURO|nr:hypothetical protein BDV30DRAFT_234697 [Aspergillus minisclerotigenes]